MKDQDQSQPEKPLQNQLQQAALEHDRADDRRHQRRLERRSHERDPLELAVTETSTDAKAQKRDRGDRRHYQTYQNRLEREEEARDYREEVKSDLEEREYQQMIEREREIDKQDLDVLAHDREDRNRYHQSTRRGRGRERPTTEVLEREHWVPHPADDHHGRRPRIVYRHGHGYITQIGPQTLQEFQEHLSRSPQERQSSHDNSPSRRQIQLPSREHHSSRSSSRTPRPTSIPLLPEQARQSNSAEQSLRAEARPQKLSTRSRVTSPTPKTPMSPPPLHGTLKHPQPHTTKSSTPPRSPHPPLPATNQIPADPPHVHFAPPTLIPRPATSPAGSEHADWPWKEPAAPVLAIMDRAKSSHLKESEYKAPSVEEDVDDDDDNDAPAGRTVV